MSELSPPARPLGLYIQPACLQHKYIRHPNSSHIFERPERLRAVLLGVAAAIARLEETEAERSSLKLEDNGVSDNSTLTPSTSASASTASATSGPASTSASQPPDDLSSLLSGLSIASSTQSTFHSPHHLAIVPPPPSITPGQVILHHPALQLAHSPPPEGQLFRSAVGISSTYLRDLYKWANEAIDRIKETGCEIPGGLGLNQGDLYLGPGSVVAIEGAIQTVCQAVDRICRIAEIPKNEPQTPPQASRNQSTTTPPNGSPYSDQNERRERQDHQGKEFDKAFCVIRPPGHHCGEDLPSGFCYVNNVVVGALHAYLEHDIDRAIIIDFDLHHGNGTQALVMPLNAASYAEDLAVKAGKPNPPVYNPKGKQRRGWKGFYGSVHDIYSYPCEDGDLDLIKDASISLSAHGQYIENIHLQPYSSEADFYERIYPMYLKLLGKARRFMDETGADPDRTIVLISAGFDACEHEHQGMQRHDRRVPVSFFSRYTRDIVAFADEHTGGKVVSVLEGGYSDRALTSAAMGHVVGLLDREGQPGWWTESELINIERATKKKRTGKIAPFPSELSTHTHLVRTHALLAHFEGSTNDVLASAAPSVVNTPQPRMTLRDRKKATNIEDDMSITPPARRAIRGKTTVQNGSTPRSKTQIVAPSRNVTPAKKKGGEVDVVLGQPDDEREPRDDLVDSMQGLGREALGQNSEARSSGLPPIPSVTRLPDTQAETTSVHDALPNRAPTAITTASGLSQDTNTSIPISELPSLSGEPQRHVTQPAVPTTVHPAAFGIPSSVAPSSIPSSSSDTPAPPPSEPAQPRIILRIPRIPSGRTSPQPMVAEITDRQNQIQPHQPAYPAQSLRTEDQPPVHLYPSLPNVPSPFGAVSLQPNDDRLAYREGSANTTSTEGEYQSAASESSGPSGGEDREKREKSSSSEIPMPGRFGA